MINTLRITSIIAACAAVVFLTLSVFLGLKPDDSKAGFIAEIQKFSKEQLTAPTGPIGDKKNAPLVVQAQAYTLKVNPPKPREIADIAVIRRAPEVRFKLIGTMIYVGMPENSKALVDSPGKGQHWVKVNDNVEGIRIEKILDGKLVYNKNGKSMTLSANNKPGSSGESEATVSEEENPSAIPVMSASGKREPPVSKKSAKQEMEEAIALLKEMSNEATGNGSAEDANNINTFIDELGKELTDANNSGGDEATASSEEPAAVDDSDPAATQTDVEAEAEAPSEEAEQTDVGAESANEAPSETPAPKAEEIKPAEKAPPAAPAVSPDQNRQGRTNPSPSMRRRRTVSE